MVLAHNIDNEYRTQDIRISQEITFDTMLLSSRTLRGLRKSGFYKPSPVQLHGIPLGKCGFDLLLEAKSGTGKTAVFSVIALEKLDIGKGLQALIIAPTREIAAQICDVMQQIGSCYEGLQIEVVMGGMPIQDDIAKFKKTVHIVVGSPGRLRHLIQDKCIDTSSVRLLVLDEADKLMEKSFLPDINYIFSALPIQKQVIMSSATYPESSQTFIKQYVQKAQHICPHNNCVLLGVIQKVTSVKNSINIVKQTQIRFEELLKILTKMQFKQCLIFCNYKVRVIELHKLLVREKWPVQQLYGQQEQTHRLDAIKTLQEYKCRILISTDLAARGIDASNVDLVINFEPPYDWQTYLHRIGRAGRFGSYGMAITILSEGKEYKNFKEVLGILNGSLHLSTLWTDEEYNLVDPNNVCLTQTPEREFIKENSSNILNNKEIWDLLSENARKDIPDTESFEQLYNSFETETQGKVETFLDLLTSFQTKCDLDDVKYTHFSVPIFPVNKYLYASIAENQMKYVSNNKLKELELLDNTKDNENHKYNLNGNASLLLSDTSENLDSQEQKQSQILHDYLNNNKSDVSTRYIGENNNEHIEVFSEHTEDLNNTRALLDAGLPSCFSSKPKKNTKMLKNNHEKYLLDDSNEYENHNITNEFFSHLNHAEIASNFKAQSGYEEDINVNVNENNKYYNHMYRDNVFKKKKYARFRKTKTSHKTEQMSDKISVSDAESISEYSSDTISSNYIQWYKQLKSRTKQVEIAVYLNEISRL